MGKRELWIEKRYITIPVWAEEPLKKLEVFCEEESGRQKVFELRVPEGPGKPGLEKNYGAPIPADQYRGKKLIFEGDFSDAFFREIQNVEEAEGMAGQQVKGCRPTVHFTPQTGWINDPNGLVYQNGVYHLYFQHNPFDTKWENMCWGHAVSTDLLHWEQQDTVLFPDDHGMIFSGSGIVNERGLLGLPKDALVFFYTAAANCNDWAAGRDSVQRIAYSMDGGRTLVKTDQGVVEPLNWENRDPKVFWHEESSAYIMMLWIEGNVFGILRSTDLLEWQLSDRVTLEGGFECPDLFCLLDDAGCRRWVFTTADGYYYLGDFDGYHFRQTARRRCAYMNKAPYAAQTYSNVPDRRVFVPWLRMEFPGKNYTGAMGIPRELSLTGEGDEARLCFRPVREFLALVGESGVAESNGICMLNKKCEEGSAAYCWDLAGVRVCYNSESGAFTVGDETVDLPAGITDFSFIVDGPVLEVTAEHDTILGMFELTTA